MSGGPLPFQRFTARRCTAPFFSVPVSYHSPTEEHEHAPLGGGSGHPPHPLPSGEYSPTPPQAAFPYSYREGPPANDPVYGQQYTYVPQPSQTPSYGQAMPFQQQFYASTAPEQAPVYPFYDQPQGQMHLEQPYGTPPYAVPIPPAELTTSSAEPPSLQYPLPIVDQHLQPPATPSDSSSSPEAYEEPQQDAAFTARDIENEAYIRTKLRVADGIPVGLNLVRSLGRDQRPEASIPTLIMLAIQGCKRSPKELTLHEIAQEFTTHLEFYRYTTTSWRASVRHALSLHKIFRQRSRKDIEGGGRGGFWHLDFSEGEGTKRLRKRLSRAQRAPKDEDTEQSTEDDMGSSFDEDDGEKSDKHAPYPSARAGPSSAARPGPSSSARAGPSPARTRRPAPQPSLDAISEPAMTGYRAPEAEAGDARFVEAGDPRFAPAGSSTSARGAHTQDRGAHIQGRGAQPRGRGRRTAGDESVQDTKGKGRA